jgi:PAS domain S-box-containing protein
VIKFNPIRNLQISDKLYIGVIITALVVLAVMALVMSSSAGNLLATSGSQRLEQEADIVQKRFVEAQQALLDDVKLLAGRPGLAQAVAGEDMDSVRTALAGGATFEFADISLVDTAGVHLLDLDEMSSAQEEALLALALQGVETTDAIVREAQGQAQFYLVASAPLRDASGQVVGGLLASQQVDQAFLDKVNLYRSSVDLVFIYEGQILDLAAKDLHQRASLLANAALLDQAAIAQALAGQIVVADDLTHVDGSPRMMVHAPLVVRGQARAVLVVLINMDEMVAFQGRLARNLIFVLVCLMVVASGATIMFARQSITAPLHRLQEAAQGIAGGDYSQRAEAKSNDEIGQLAHVFNEMSDAIQGRERALQQQHDFLQQVIDINPFFIFAKDRQGRYTLANQAFATAFGVTLQELLGQTDADINPDGELAVRYRRDDLQVLDSRQELFIPQERIVKSDGEVLWRQSTKRPIVDEDGVARHVLGTIIDITDLKRAQDERVHFINQLRAAADVVERISAILEPNVLLNEAVTLLQERFDFSHVFVFLLDDAGRELTARAGSPIGILGRCGEVGQRTSQQGDRIPLDHETSVMARAARSRTIVLVNDARAEPDFFTHPLLPDTCAEVAMPLLAGERLLGVFDVQDVRANRFSPSDLDVLHILSGQISIALENAHLFAERKRAREALALTRDQALAASRLKGQLLANVSHDLRTPLGVIIGYGEMLQRGIYGPLSEQQGSVVQRMIRNTRNLTGMVNKLMAQAQIEAGVLKFDVAPFAPNELLAKMLSTMHVLAESAGVQLNTSVADDMPPTLQGDLDWVYQILANLVENALKFTEQGAVDVYLYRHNATHWAMQVSDTGSGIPAEAQAYIFEAFRQVDGTATREHGGSGLGLSIVKQLTTMMGGEVTLASEPGQGTTFTVLLPLAPIQETIS